MKKIYFLLLLVYFSGFSQQRNPRQDFINFAPGKVIVKLKDNVDAKITYGKSGKGTAQTDIAKLLGVTTRVKSSTVLFDEQFTNASVSRKASNFSDSRLKSVSSVKNTFLLELTNEQDNVLELVETLKTNLLVEYAEPDYIYSIGDYKEDSKVYTGKELATFLSTSANDPLFPQQNNIVQTKLNEVWDTTTGDGSQIIAILDTGIDYHHPDLVSNIWINQQELNGIPGFDDDGNGYIDDIYGWDFINNGNKPLDDNKHGTHVAGIAGAVGNNNIGIAGGAWNVKLMPIKVFQSNGTGNASTIALGIAYAATSGATVINMSFGSGAESFTMRAALENAYATSVLVASAGNSSICIGPGLCPDKSIGAPFYPAAYSFVLGVEDAAEYSNFDQDGPIFSGYNNLLNYELKAPGTQILSTVPNGGYQKLTGTSMSAPLVAAGIALYKQLKPTDSQELLFGNLINTITTFVDFRAALDVVPTPQVQVLSAIANDVAPGQNGNGFLEPNEIVNIIPLVKNYWGPTNDVRIGIEFAEFEDQTKATILTEEAQIGSITAYATLQKDESPLKIKLASNIANNVIIKFNLKVWSGPNKEYLTTTPFIINAKNSILLFGAINYDMTLSSDKEYLVSDNLFFTSNAMVTILPGTIIKISDNKRISFIDNSSLNAIGLKDQKIQFTNEDSFGWGAINFNSTGVSNLNQVIFSGISRYDGSCQCYIPGSNSAVNFTNVLWVGNYAYSAINSQAPNFNFHASTIISTDHGSIIGFGKFYDGIGEFKGVNLVQYDVLGSSTFGSTVVTIDNADQQNTSKPRNEINIIPKHFSLNVSSWVSGSVKGIKYYLGSSNLNIVKKYIFDGLINSNSSAIIETNEINLTPYDSAHGIVWKVVVDGKDAQDEYDLMDPVGVGTHEFKVYFNREMDQTKPPQISYGVRQPYNQKIISEPGTWSEDGKIYSVTHEVKIGAADGINRIRVQDARDLDYFDIPVEDSRFNMLVQSAGSASTGFEATPGLGKIVLDWEVPEVILLEDVLGYNMYRYELKSDNTETEPVKINTALIGDINYTDFNVEEGKNYYYKYKILRTNFEETDYSITVMSSPLTSKLGDSNGDFAVNVMDLVQTVDYILGNNPTPYIFKAADVNNDSAINVLDIVGTVDIILNTPGGKTGNSKTIKYYSNQPIGDATFYWENNDLYVESLYPITGLQLAFGPDFHYTQNTSLSAFEWLNYSQNSDKVLMMYSFTNSIIPAGKTKILTATTSPGSVFDITKAVVASSNGRKLNPLYRTKVLDVVDAPAQTDQPQFLQVYPNPSSGIFTMDYYLPATMERVEVGIYDLTGKKVWTSSAFKNTSGYSKKEIDVSFLPKNIYFLVVDVIGDFELKKRNVKKIIIK